MPHERVSLPKSEREKDVRCRVTGSQPASLVYTNAAAANIIINAGRVLPLGFSYSILHLLCDNSLLYGRWPRDYARAILRFLGYKVRPLCRGRYQ